MSGALYQYQKVELVAQKQMQDNKCIVNEKKHLICRIYPISAYDVQLVSKISDKKCGYYFDYEK